MTKRISYTEPADYFPVSVRKKAKIGEFAEMEKETTKETTKKAPEKKATKS